MLGDRKKNEVIPVENLLLAINCVLPVFLVISLGALIRRDPRFPPELFNQISRLSFQYLLPCMLFHSIYNADLSYAFNPSLLVFLVAHLLVWYGLGYAIFTFTVPDPRTRGAFIQTFFRTNIAIVGVSMATSLMGEQGLASMTIAIAVLVPLYNTLAVITLQTCRGGKVSLKPTLIGIAKNPLIIGCLTGILFLVAGIPLPASVLKALDWIGNTGSTATLIALGASLQFSGLRANWRKLVLANLLRLVIAPGVALAIAIGLGFRGVALGTVLLSTAASLATTSYAMAIAMDSDYELTGQIVVTTSFLCCLTLFCWIFLLKQTGMI